MFYMLEKTGKNSIEYCMESVKLSLSDFSYLDDYEKLMLEVIKDDKFTKLLSLPERIINLIADAVINNRDIEYLNEKLAQENLPLFSLIINQVRIYKNKYKKLLNIKNCECVVMTCDKDNLIESLELCKKMNIEVMIKGTSISLSEYKKILSNYDLSSLENVKIKYQDHNSLLSVKELYETSTLINKIIKDVKKYNLSPLEKIIYVYDFVKKKEYKECEENLKESRDIDKILKGDNIVCVGYSNLFNAILKGLGINAIPLVSKIKKHQRSLVYVKDSKYNIDGVYAFDPTWDSKKDDSYINNYDYFGMTLQNSEKEVPSDIGISTIITYENMTNILNLDNNIDSTDNLEIINILEFLFEFVGEDTFRELEENINHINILNCSEERIREIYNNFISKYNAKEISPSTFMMALYNTRIIQYYNGTINIFDIEDIVDAAQNRTTSQRFEYQEFRNRGDKLLAVLDYYCELGKMIDNLMENQNTYMEKKENSIRLLKVLRNRQKQLTEEEK